MLILWSELEAWRLLHANSAWLSNNVSDSENEYREAGDRIVALAERIKADRKENAR